MNEWVNRRGESGRKGEMVHNLYLVTMLCSFDPPPSPPSGAKERRMEGSSLLKFFSGINAPL